MLTRVEKKDKLLIEFIKKRQNTGFLVDIKSFLIKDKISVIIPETVDSKKGSQRHGTTNNFPPQRRGQTKWIIGD